MRDIAGAHLGAADSALDLPLALNVGAGSGGSVREDFKLVCEAASRNNVVVFEAERRPGELAFFGADVSLIKNSIGFNAKNFLKVSTPILF